MEAILRAALIYVALLLIFRIAGNRSLAKMTAFDFVLLLIIGESASQGLIGDDFSIINAVLVISTLVCIELVLSAFQRRSSRLDRWLDGAPAIVARDGQLLQEKLDMLRIDKYDILEAARRSQGITELDDIAVAIMERDGQISIIPRRDR